MSIENFLSDFDEQNKRNKQTKLREEKDKEIQKASNKKYLTDFQEYYRTNLIPELKQIQEKLEDKFSLNYKNKPDTSLGIYSYTTELTPKFKHNVKRIDIEIEIIAEEKRRRITLSGRAFGVANRIIKIDEQRRLQNFIEAPKKIDLEIEITNILNKIFLTK